MYLFSRDAYRFSDVIHLQLSIFGNYFVYLLNNLIGGCRFLPSFTWILFKKCTFRFKLLFLNSWKGRSRLFIKLLPTWGEFLLAINHEKYQDGEGLRSVKHAFLFTQITRCPPELTTKTTTNCFFSNQSEIIYNQFLFIF